MNPDFKIRFFLDSLMDGARGNDLIAWPALDTRENKEVWLLGRKVNDKVWPLAVILTDSAEAVKRYAPAIGQAEYDFSQVKK